MKPTRVTEVLVSLLKTRWPVFLWGPPGAGKSSIVQQVAASQKMNLIDIRASLLDPTDLRGIPSVEAGRATWCPPSFLPGEKDKKGILFFDELNAAPPLVQASLYQLTLDRRVGEYVLPDGWLVVGAGNRSADRSVVFRMPAALANRFIHLDFEIDYDDWRAWALSQRIHPVVIAFLGMRRELLFDMSQPERGFPTPRSWEIVSDALKQLGNPRQAEDVLIGIVGEGAAMEFLAYSEQSITEDKIKNILADPSGAELPEDLGDLYALVSYIGTRATESAVASAAGVLINRLSPELAVLLARDVLSVNIQFVKDPGYIAFLAEHGDLLT